MSAFFEYLRNITYYLMFATVVGMIAPTGKYRKFVSLVMGFILLAIMLAPLARWSGEIPVTQWFSGVVPQYAMPTNAETNYTVWRNNYLRTAFESQLEAQLTNLLTQNNFAVYSAAFTYTDDFSQITAARVAVSRAAYAEENRRVPFIRIEPVQINRPDGSTAEEDCPTATAAKNLISEFYNIDRAHIHVEVRER